jgi:abequosyltransferase
LRWDKWGKVAIFRVFTTNGTFCALHNVEMNKKIKLSVAIPTYNGAGTIRETLDSIIPQLQENVDIVISDNASTDNTAEIVREYQSKYSNIRYFRNEDNVGADRNFDQAIRRSQGEFVWLFSDDDCLDAGAIAHIIKVLNKYPSVVAVFVNWAVWNESLTEVKKPRVLEIREDVFCEDQNQFISTTKLSPLLVSSNIVNRDAWIGSDSQSYAGTNWIHYLTIMSMLPRKHSYCVATPYVKFRSGLFGWKNDYLVRLNNSLSLINSLFKFEQKGYRHECLVDIGRVGILDLPVILIGAKFQGIPVRDIMRTVVCFARYPQFWLMSAPVLFTPSYVFHLIGRQRVDAIVSMMKIVRVKLLKIQAK